MTQKADKFVVNLTEEESVHGKHTHEMESWKNMQD